MSFILDALKKSETERQEQGPAEFANVPSSDDSTGAPRWLWVLGFLLAINVVVLLGLLLRNDTPDIINPPPAAQTDTATPGSGSFADRLEEVRDQQPPSAAALQPDTAAADEGVTAAPAQVAPAQIAPVQAAPAETASASQFTLRELPTADELRVTGKMQIAELHLDIHVYSDAPADRFVFINMVRHQENSRLAEGPVVREITPEGVILDYVGTEFLLPRE
jgi:general secretion pathway protein B